MPGHPMRNTVLTGRARRCTSKAELVETLVTALFRRAWGALRRLDRYLTNEVDATAICGTGELKSAIPTTTQRLIGLAYFYITVH
jgi:hypothetical protein